MPSADRRATSCGLYAKDPSCSTSYFAWEFSSKSKGNPLNFDTDGRSLPFLGLGVFSHVLEYKGFYLLCSVAQRWLPLQCESRASPGSHQGPMDHHPTVLLRVPHQQKPVSNSCFSHFSLRSKEIRHLALIIAVIYISCSGLHVLHFRISMLQNQGLWWTSLPLSAAIECNLQVCLVAGLQMHLRQKCGSPEEGQVMPLMKLGQDWLM